MTAEWLDTEYFGNTLRLWILAGAITAGAVIGLRLLKAFFVHRLGKVAERSNVHWDNVIVELIRGIRLASILAVGVYLGSRVIVLPAQAGELIRIGLTIVLAIQAVNWGKVFINLWLERQFARPDNVQGQGVGYGAVRFVALVILWAVIGLLALDNMGIEVTALIAGLGVGGIAVALAVQNILGDIFCSLSIVLDRPFEVGDFVVVGDMAGTVENVGVKTTRIRSLGGEQLVFSNSDLVNSRLRNYKRMYERRIVFEFGVTYQTPAEKVEKIPGIVREIIEGLEDVRLDRAHFKSYGDFALIFEVVFYVKRPEYNAYMDNQQAINLGLMRAFEKEGIEFAYPTQMLYVQRIGGAEERASEGSDGRSSRDGRAPEDERAGSAAGSGSSDRR